MKKLLNISFLFVALLIGSLLVSPIVFSLSDALPNPTPCDPDGVVA